MNTTSRLMKSTKSALLIAISLGIGMSANNAWANDNDSANIQDSVQINTTEGERNTSIQTADQYSKDIRDGNTRGNSGSSQTNTQDGLTHGSDNYTGQRNVQRSTNVRTSH